MATRNLTVRLPEELFAESESLARERNVSLNRLVQEGLTTLLRAQRYQRLYEAFGELGDDPDEMDVEFAAEAQFEATREDERAA
ncbi:MAG: hypothetical protein ACK47B_07235 [Armatimonadota bacterium]